MSKTGGIRWGRILLGGFLVEVVLIVMTAPVFIFMGTQTMMAIVSPALFLVDLLFAYWVARKAQAHFLLHGLLVGVVATAIYTALVLAQFGSLTPVIEMYGTIMFVTANAARFLGAGIGGVLAKTRNQAAQQ
jgi:hypothetical protein